MIERVIGGHVTGFARHCDRGGGPRDCAATETGTREGEHSSGRRTSGTVDTGDYGRGVGEVARLTI